LHVVSGFQGDNLDELQKNLKTKKIIGVDDGGGVEVRTVDIPYQARQAKAEADEKAIYHFGMGLNTSGLKDTNATTNMGIQMLYSSLELKAGNLQKRLNKVLKNILKVVLDEINEEYGTDYQMSDVKLNFKRKAMVNETEQITAEKTKAEAQQVRVNTILNAAAEIGEEQVLKSICEQLDLKYEDIKEQLEKDKEPVNLATAKTLLDNAEPEPEPKPEPDIIE
jgi:N-acetylmuramic acid 6-phosphate (MurNAc-6-P) etherase